MKLSEPIHLSKFERTIMSGSEWRFMTADWMVLQLTEGVAYVFDRKGSKELPLGGLIVCPPKTEFTLTASVLGQAIFWGTAIRVGSLAGFLSSMERQCLETEVAAQCAPFLLLPPEHPLAKRATDIFSRGLAPALHHRLAFVQAFSELIGPQLHAALNKGKESEKAQQDAKGRLRQLVSQMPESEICTLSLEELAKMLHCCERHTSRLCRETWGTGFVSYVSDIRLKTACQLLLEGNRKIIDVALESGHGSIAHFNYVFKKRFHMTPTEWRQRQLAPTRRGARALQTAAMSVLLLLSAAGISPGLSAAGATNGVTNKPTATSTNANAGARTDSAARPKLTFRVDRYEVRGNTVLPNDLITRVLAPYTGDAVDISRITNAMAAVQLEYFQRGYITVKVTAPPQQVTNRVVYFQATEGRIAAVKVMHNRYYSSNNIISALPYVQTLVGGDRILNGKIFQTELDWANSNPDRQISPEVRPGLEPGTTALILDVKDRLPLHGRLEYDNYSPPGTPETRVIGNVSYGNLWQLDHTLGLQYGFSPELLKPSLDDTQVRFIPLDAPNVTYYSGFYRAPLGPPESVESEIAQDPNHFGYNETTKQFTLPVSTGRPEFSAYASRSTTGPTIPGSIEPVFASSNQIVSKQLITQQYTSQTSAGGRLSFPLPQWKDIQSSWNIGVDYKEDKVVTLETNYFYTETIVTHGSTVHSPPTISETTTSVPGPESAPSLNYTPMSLGWTGWRQDHWFQSGPAGDLLSRMDANFSLVAGMGGILYANREFPVLISNSKLATTEFVALHLQVSRTQMLPDNFVLYTSLSGQWANEPLLNLEELAIGGNATVRGYREGEYYADTGFVEQTEVRTPTYWRGMNRRVGTQFTAFMDYGQGYQLDSSEALDHEALWGGGAGVNFNLGSHVESHIIVGWPLLNSTDSKSGHPRITFSLSAQL